jgi:NAD(P)-dependent dehydrogenase (short-subunit alcohol dehydrogenase family)
MRCVTNAQGAALVSVAKSLSQELGSRGTRITSVSLGPVATDLWLGQHGLAETVASTNGSTATDVRDEMAVGNADRATSASPTGQSDPRIAQLDLADQAPGSVAAAMSRVDLFLLPDLGDVRSRVVSCCVPADSGSWAGHGRASGTAPSWTQHPHARVRSDGSQPWAALVVGERTRGWPSSAGCQDR